MQISLQQQWGRSALSESDGRAGRPCQAAVTCCVSRLAVQAAVPYMLVSPHCTAEEKQADRRTRGPRQKSTSPLCRRSAAPAAARAPTCRAGSGRPAQKRQPINQQLCGALLPHVGHHACTLRSCSLFSTHDCARPVANQATAPAGKPGQSRSHHASVPKAPCPPLT